MSYRFWRRVKRIEECLTNKKRHPEVEAALLRRAMRGYRETGVIPDDLPPDIQERTERLVQCLRLIEASTAGEWIDDPRELLRPRYSGT